MIKILKLHSTPLDTMPDDIREWGNHAQLEWQSIDADRPWVELAKELFSGGELNDGTLIQRVTSPALDYVHSMLGLSDTQRLVFWVDELGDYRWPGAHNFWATALWSNTTSRSLKGPIYLVCEEQVRDEHGDWDITHVDLPEPLKLLTCGDCMEPACYESITEDMEARFYCEAHMVNSTGEVSQFHTDMMDAFRNLFTISVIMTRGR